MKLSMSLSYAGGFKEAAKQVVDLEKAGLDVVWVAAAYELRLRNLGRGVGSGGRRS